MEHPTHEDFNRSLRVARPPTIYVGRAVCTVDASPKVLHYLDNALAVAVEGAFWARKARPNWDGKWHPFKKDRNTFPTGLLPRVRRLLPTARVVDDRQKPPVRPIDPYMLLAQPEKGEEWIEVQGEKRLVPRDVQLAGVIGILETGHGIMAIGTGAGKTESSLLVACHVHGKCVIVVHRKDLLHQWAERIKIRTRQQAALIGDGRWDMIAGAPDMKFVVVMPQTAQLDPELFRDHVKDAQTLIVDEAHRSSASQKWYSVTQRVPAYFRCGLTGTPETGAAEKDLRFEAATGPIIFRQRAGELAELGLVVPVEVQYHIADYGIEPSADDWMIVRRELIELNQERNAKIVDLAVEESQKGKRSLIICDTVRHARTIASILRGTNVRARLLTGHNTSAIRADAHQDLRTGVLETIVATTVLDEGIDIREIDTIILAAGGKAAARFLQRCGRAIRTSPGKMVATIHDFLDLGHRYLHRHSVTRIRAARKEGFRVILPPGFERLLRNS